MTTPRRPDPRRLAARHAPWAVGLAVGGVVLGPGLGPGYVLRYDMVFVPDPPLSAVVMGAGNGFPRAVPSDAVVGALGLVLPGHAVQSVLLLALFALAAAGAARLVPGDALVPRLAAAVFYVWNPFVAERLLLGQWAMLLGYAGLPWVLYAAARPVSARFAPRLVTALVPAAVGGFSALLLSGLVAGACAVARPARAALRAVPLVLVALLVLALPWLVPALGSGAGTDPAAVELFAPRADTPFGVVGSLLSLGGVWNANAVPLGFEHPVLATARLGLSAAGIAGWVWLLWRGPRPGYGVGLSLAAGAGLAVALVGATGPGRELVAALVEAWPGFGPLRDGQLYVAPLALLQAVGVAGVALWLGRGETDGAETRGSPPLARPDRDGSSVSGKDGRTPAAADERDASPAARSQHRPPAPEQHRSSTPPLRPTRLLTATTTATATAAVVLALLPPVLLPGLAWGASGELRPVHYPPEWHQVQRLVDADPRPGALLTLPWSAYRGLPWDGTDRPVVVLDPATKLVDRPVVFNDELRVSVDGEVRVAAGEDPLARQVAPLVADGWPVVPRPDTARQLGELGVRYILVDRAAALDYAEAVTGDPAPATGTENEFLSGAPGVDILLDGERVILFCVRDDLVNAENYQLSGLEVTGWLITVGATLFCLLASGSSAVSAWHHRRRHPTEPGRAGHP